MKKLPRIIKAQSLKSSEHQEQSAFCRVLESYHIPYFAIPNGGKRSSVIAGRILKMEGVKAGVPDLFILRGCYFMASNKKMLFAKGLFLELKTVERRKEKNGGLSPAQLEWKDTCLNEGYGWEVVYGWEEGLTYLKKYNLMK